MCDRSDALREMFQRSRQGGAAYGRAGVRTGTGKPAMSVESAGTVNTIVNDAVMSQSACVPMRSLVCLLHANESSGSKYHELANKDSESLWG